MAVSKHPLSLADPVIETTRDGAKSNSSVTNSATHPGAWLHGCVRPQTHPRDLRAQWQLVTFPFFFIGFLG